MKPMVKQVKELIEASEPDMTVIEMNDELFACPRGIALWQEYRSRHPDGLKVPPADLTKRTDPELMPYAEHVDCCDDCNEISPEGVSLVLPFLERKNNMALKMVTFNGILTGQVSTLTSKCVVAAEEVTDDYTRTVRLTKVHIESVAETLPDDTYELSFDGMKQMLRYEGGFWNAI